MVDILDKLHDYVPMETEKKEEKCSAGNVEVLEAFIHTILMGGDQLTSAWIRGAQGIRQNASDAKLRLEGLDAFPLDWHAKLNLLEVCYTCILIDLQVIYCYCPSI